MASGAVSGAANGIASLQTLRLGGRKRAAVYARRSPSGGGMAVLEEESLDNQIEQCIARAAEDGACLVATFQEVEYRWELWERPQLTALRQLITAGELDVVYVLWSARLGAGDLLSFLFVEAARYGVSYVFLKDPIDDTSPMAGLMRDVQARFAQWELWLTRMRTADGRRKRLEAGKMLFCGWVRYGYHWGDPPQEGQPVLKGTTRTRRVIYEPEAAIVRRLFRWVDGGGSVAGFAAQLDGEHVPPPGGSRGPGRRWRQDTLCDMLRDPIYKGAPVVRRTRRVRADGKWQNQPRPQEEWHWLPPETAPAIVDAALWDRVQPKIGARKRGAGRHGSMAGGAPFLLRGVVRCAACGRPLQCVVTRRGDRTRTDGSAYEYRYYACGPRDAYARPVVTCPAAERPRLRADGPGGLDQEVWRRVLAYTTAGARPRDDGRTRTALEAAIRTHGQRAVAAQRALDRANEELVLAETDADRASLRRVKAAKAAEQHAEQAAQAGAARELATLAERAEVEAAAERLMLEHAEALAALVPGLRADMGGPTAADLEVMRGVLAAWGVVVEVQPRPVGRPGQRDGASWRVLPWEPWELDDELLIESSTSAPNQLKQQISTAQSPRSPAVPGAPDPQTLRRLLARVRIAR